MPHEMDMVTQATHADCEAVAALATRTFIDTFGHLYTAENRDAHLASYFSPAFFKDALDSGDTLLMLHDGAVLIGYCKIGRVRLPVKPIPAGAQEIHRVYVDKPYQGRGLGKALMLHILSLPRIATAPVVYLGVWEENLKAQALYKQYHFVPKGHYLYQVGDQFDKEIIMARVR
ncbi:MAG: N-acetyltransferase [Pseudomonadota bacterium]